MKRIPTEIVVIPKIKICVKNIKDKETDNKIDFLIFGFSESKIVVRNANGIHDQDAINPKCPASINPLSFGDDI